MVPIVSFVGLHNSGKTTVLTGVINYLTREGIKTAVIKHASHSLYIQPVTDSDRLFQAGAGVVYVTSPDTAIHYSRHKKEKSLTEIYAEVSPGVELVITEGYKQEPNPKIEVIRREISPVPMRLENVIARVADMQIDDLVPVFAFDQHQEIARFLISTFNLS